ncbi:MAG: transporter [Actinomycetia bacterium]|nr:transporter [Actinomycetes bacterium]
MSVNVDTTNDPIGGGAATAVLSLDGIVVRFGGVTAVDGVSLSVAAGEVLGLIGPNGAGKTTLFDVISGVRFPNAGRVMLNGADVTRSSPIRRARAGMRRTYQQVQTFGWLSVADNVLAGLDWQGGGGGAIADLVGFPTRRRLEQERRARVEEVLDMCGLTAVAATPTAALPIGLARMVELARAIVDPPTLLLLDEPNSGLGEEEGHALAAQVQRIATETSCAMVLVEHDVDFIMANCNRIVVLQTGSVLATGTPAEIQGNAAVRTAYLGEP